MAGDRSAAPTSRGERRSRAKPHRAHASKAVQPDTKTDYLDAGSGAAPANLRIDGTAPGYRPKTN
jgi:hypothetical protein